jgi:hypothetical protein
MASLPPRANGCTARAARIARPVTSEAARAAAARLTRARSEQWPWGPTRAANTHRAWAGLGGGRFPSPPLATRVYMALGVPLTHPAYCAASYRCWTRCPHLERAATRTSTVRSHATCPTGECAEQKQALRVPSHRRRAACLLTVGVMPVVCNSAGAAPGCWRDSSPTQKTPSRTERSAQPKRTRLSRFVYPRCDPPLLPASFLMLNISPDPGSRHLH